MIRHVSRYLWTAMKDGSRKPAEATRWIKAWGWGAGWPLALTTDDWRQNSPDNRRSRTTASSRAMVRWRARMRALRARIRQSLLLLDGVLVLDGVLGVAESNGVFEVLDILFEFPGLANPDGEKHGVAVGLSQRRGGGHDGQHGLLAAGEVGIFNPPDISGHSAFVSDSRSARVPGRWGRWGLARFLVTRGHFASVAWLDFVYVLRLASGTSSERQVSGWTAGGCTGQLSW